MKVYINIILVCLTHVIISDVISSIDKIKKKKKGTNSHKQRISHE